MNGVCILFKFPCNGVLIEIAGCKEAFVNMNNIMKEVVVSDLVTVLKSSNLPVNRYYQNIDSTDISILNGENIYQKTSVDLYQPFSNPNGYMILAKAMNAKFCYLESHLRNYMHIRAEEIHQLDRMLLTCFGLLNPSFAGSSDLQKLDDQNHFEIKLDRDSMKISLMEKIYQKPWYRWRL